MFGQAKNLTTETPRPLRVFSFSAVTPCLRGEKSHPFLNRYPVSSSLTEIAELEYLMASEKAEYILLEGIIAT